MRVKVTIGSTGHLFGETFVIDVGQPQPGGRELTLQDVAEHFMRYGVVVGDRWISPFRLMEFQPVEGGTNA
jgi:hypothetical protein